MKWETNKSSEEIMEFLKVKEQIEKENKNLKDISYLVARKALKAGAEIELLLDGKDFYIGRFIRIYYRIKDGNLIKRKNIEEYDEVFEAKDKKELEMLIDKMIYETHDDRYSIIEWNI